MSWIFLCASAFLAGMVNSIAGGGTLLTFPALVWALGTSPSASVVANATSTVAVFPGSVASVWGYRQELKPVVRWLAWLTIPSFLGGALGTLLVAKRDPAEFKFLVPWLILGATSLFILQPSLGKWLTSRTTPESSSTISKVVVVLSQFFIALYGGYFGAGIGILMLAALGLLGLPDIHHINALKTFLASTINSISVVLFISFGLVNWKLAIPMIVASSIGGYSGARLARKLDKNVVRTIVILIGLSVSLYYLLRTYATG